MSAIPSYIKIAKVEGNLKGATVTWNWSWSGTEHGIPAPNVLPSGQYCLVTNQAIEDKPAVPPNAGNLTLTPSVVCGSEVMTLDPIVLTIGLNFVPPPQPCCFGSEPCVDPTYDCNVFGEQIKTAFCSRLPTGFFPNCYSGYLVIYGPYPFECEVIFASTGYTLSDLNSSPNGYFRLFKLTDNNGCVVLRPYGLGYNNCEQVTLKGVGQPCE